MELNKDIATRDKLIFGKYRPNIYEHQNGINYFTDMSLATLRQLINNRFIDPEYRYRNAPSVQEIYDFMLKYPKYKAHGCTTDIGHDNIVMLKGVKKGTKTDSPQEFQEFKELFGNANMFLPNTMTALYDIVEGVRNWVKL